MSYGNESLAGCEQLVQLMIDVPQAPLDAFSASLFELNCLLSSFRGLGYNQFTGGVPSTLCNVLDSLVALDISNNQLAGEFHTCFLSSIVPSNKRGAIKRVQVHSGAIQKAPDWIIAYNSHQVGASIAIETMVRDEPECSSLARTSSLNFCYILKGTLLVRPIRETFQTAEENPCADSPVDLGSLPCNHASTFSQTAFGLPGSLVNGTYFLFLQATSRAA